MSQYLRLIARLQVLANHNEARVRGDPKLNIYTHYIPFTIYLTLLDSLYQVRILLGWRMIDCAPARAITRVRDVCHRTESLDLTLMLSSK